MHFHAFNCSFSRLFASDWWLTWVISMPAKAMRSLDFGLYFFIHTDVSVKKSSITFNKLATDEKVSLIMFKIAWRGAPILINVLFSNLFFFQSQEKVFGNYFNLMDFFFSYQTNNLKQRRKFYLYLKKYISFHSKVFNMESWLSNKNL